ncbi:hypothetical protein B0H14DRAFT_3458741 [Mycena olivaceomarginata]|nr:hypothetical protein B0H14DRAFT_3458741 [Mycena olivaceomarginata]
MTYTNQVSDHYKALVHFFSPFSIPHVAYERMANQQRRWSPITMHKAPFYCLEALPMFVALLLWNVCRPGRMLVGPDSEFPKEKKKSKKSKREKAEDGEAMDLRLLTVPQPL